MPLPDNARCRACGYALRGLPTNICPECGRPFDPTNLRSVHLGAAPPTRLARFLLAPPGLATPLLLAALLLTLLYLTPVAALSLHPSLVDVRYYFRFTHGLHRFALLTADENLYTFVLYLLPLATAALLLRTLLRAALILFWREPRAHIRDRSTRALLCFAMLLACLALIAFGWPGRIALFWSRDMLTASPSIGYMMPPSNRWGVSMTQLPPIYDAGVRHLWKSQLRLASMRLLVEHAPASAPECLLRAIPAESSPLVLATQLRILSLYRRPADASLLESFLTHADPTVRAAAADALGILYAPPYPLPPPWGPEPWSTATDPPIGLDAIPATLGRPSAPGEIAVIPETPFPLPAARRAALERMMLTGSTDSERRAAARALLRWPPANLQFRYAEWGVWLADPDGSLESPQSIPDDVPPFVHRIGNPDGDFFATPRKWYVYKPVIHLTVNAPISVDCSVAIRSGRPYVAFPRPDDLTRVPDPNPLDPATLAKSPTSLPSFTPLGQGYDGFCPSLPYMSNPFNEDTLRFPPSGGLLWQALIVSPTQLPWMSLPQVGSNPRFAWWSRLRTVPCSWIAGRNESDRFLYYDGPTLCQVPFSIKCPPNAPDALEVLYDYAAYARYVKKNALVGEVFLIDVAPQSTRYLTTPLQANAAPQRISLPPTAPSTPPDRAFHARLVAAGLTADEADGLIDTWRPRFFQSPGRRALVLLSRPDYDRLLPLELRPQPTASARVGILVFELP